MTIGNNLRGGCEFRSRGWTLSVVCVATFMLVLDITVVLVALPRIREDLRADLSGVQWVVDSYTLVLATLLLTSGVLGDRLGRRGVFITGMAVFTGGSLACGLATTIGILVACRVLQGVGAVMLFGVGLPLIASQYPAGRTRNRALALFGAAAGVADALGPLVGGLLIEEFGWRSIFFVNVPIGVTTIVVAVWRIESTGSREPRGLDWLGTATVTIGFFLGVYALIRGGREGWATPAIASSAVSSIALLVGFVVIELRRESPMLDLSLFSSTMFSVNACVAFIVQGALLATLTYLSIFIQNTLGDGPIAAGMKVLPLSITTVVVASGAGWLLNRISARILIAASAGFSCLGLLAMAHLDASSSWTVLIPGLLLAAVGLGLTSTVSNEVALSSVLSERSGMATGALNSIKQAGVAAGIAAFGALFAARTTNVTADRLRHDGQFDPAAVHTIATDAGDGAGLHAAAHSPPTTSLLAEHAIRAGTASGLNALLVAAAVAAAAATILGYVFTRRPT